MNGGRGSVRIGVVATGARPGGCVGALGLSQCRAANPRAALPKAAARCARKSAKKPLRRAKLQRARSLERRGKYALRRA